jgi:hypothetical protein
MHRDSLPVDVSLPLNAPVSRDSFERTERLLHKELLEARVRFHANQGGAGELTAALRRFAAFILEGTVRDEPTDPGSLGSSKQTVPKGE